MINWCELKIELLGETRKNLLPPNIKLPMLPKAVLEFTQKAKDPNTNNIELGTIIESDAGLTCDLLRFINSAAYGLRQKVNSAQQCLGLLGVNKVKLLLATMLARNAMKSRDCKLINLQQFWNSNLERALFAREIACHLGADKDAAYAGGMLQDFLLPILSSEMMNEYIQYLESTNAPAESTRLALHQFELKHFGWTHSLAAAHLLAEWEFPEELICVLALHDRGVSLLEDDRLGKTTAAAVAASACLPDPLNQHPNGLEELLMLEQILPGFQLIDCAAHIRAEMESEAGHNLANYMSLENRLEALLHRSNTESITV